MNTEFYSFKDQILYICIIRKWYSFQDLDATTKLETKNFDALTIGTIYQVVELTMRTSDKGDQVVAGVIEKEAPLNTMQYVYLPSSLAKNFNSAKVKQWADKISKGAKAFFKYKSKMQTNFGTGYKFIAEWVKSSES